MYEGMMWYTKMHEEDKTLKQKIDRAVEYYFLKYGECPDICFVHPNMIEDDYDGDIEVRESASVMNNYLWIGVKDEN